jgi:RNA polymerase sigma-70 factor (sigma-E family)
VDDLDGFGEFVAVRSTSLIRFGYLLVGDYHRAEDLVQTALMRLATRWRRVQDPGAYVARIMVNESLSWWRRRRFAEQPLDATVAPPASGGTAESVVRRSMFVTALRRLTPRQRAVLALRYYEDRSEAETAEILGCSIGTVKSQTNHALARLRQLAPELAELRELTEA